MWHRHSCLCRVSPRLRSQALSGRGCGRGTDKSVCATLVPGLRQARPELVTKVHIWLSALFALPAFYNQVLHRMIITPDQRSSRGGAETRRRDGERRSSNRFSTPRLRVSASPRDPFRRTLGTRRFYGQGYGKLSERHSFIEVDYHGDAWIPQMVCARRSHFQGGFVNCFEHPSQPAVSMCSRCGKGACRSCANDVGGATLCYSCANLARAEANHEIAQRAHAAAVEEQDVRDAARRRLRRAHIVGAVCGITFGLIAGIAFSQQPNSPFGGSGVVILVPLFAAFYAYAFGSISLTLPLIWGWWWRLFRRVGFSCAGGCVFWTIAITTFFTVPLWIAIVYGVFGGGLYEYLKARRMAAQRPQ